MKHRVVIGSRGSRLALWQAEWVKAALEARDTRTSIEIQIIRTSGDMQKDVSLTVIGGKGVFTKELEEALLDGRIDLAVHSLKDLPTTLPDNLTIAAIPEREDARDALVLRSGGSDATNSLATLLHGAVVGTSSPRRLAQLKHVRPDVEIKDLRGNVDTRLRKLDAGEYDAVILAAAGLRRLGLENRINTLLDSDEMLPAVGQGALAVEARTDDRATLEMVAPLNHLSTRAACTAERALLRGLGGGCQLPIAGHARVSDAGLRLDGLVASVDGEALIRETIEGATDDAALLGARLAEILLSRGASSLLLSPV
jgi:hydroxymethylbilane synthase